MGLFRISGRLTGPTGRSEIVELLVDTGATLLVIPRSLAERLGIAARRAQPVLIAGGQRDVWPVGEVRLGLDGQEATTPCFIAPDGPSLLGAVALESLFLAVDPVAKRLIPVEGFVGRAALSACLPPMHSPLSPLPGHRCPCPLGPARSARTRLRP